MLPTGLCNIGHCALTPISRSDITSVFSFDNHQKPHFVMLSEQKSNEIKIDFSQKRHPNFCSFGYNYSRRLLPLWVRSAFVLPSLWVRSAFAPKSGDKEYSKWDEKAPKHHLSICRKNLTKDVRPQLPPQFTSHFTYCKVNTMTISYIRSSVNCEL